jgi:ApaG protein
MAKYEFEVQVLPEYLPEQSRPEKELFSFSYTILVVNRGEIPAQLIARHWIIKDALGHVQEAKGLGVVGEQPLLKPNEAFQYSSGCQLRTPSGTMEGSYFCVAEDGERFDVPIPMFVLQAESDRPPYLH